MINRSKFNIWKNNILKKQDMIVLAWIKDFLVELKVWNVEENNDKLDFMKNKNCSSNTIREMHKQTMD